MHITLIEDNYDLREEIVFLLQHAGYQVEGFSCAYDFYRYFSLSAKMNILLLDLGLPGEDGLLVAKKLKGTAGLGIIMLTARGSLSERISGLDHGADVYLTKPVDMRELIAVIESVKRRLTAEIPVDIKNSDSASWCLDDAKRNLKTSCGQHIELTATEGQILYTLAKVSPKPVSRKSLTESIGENYAYYDERRLETIISRLRRKLKLTGSKSSAIKAARGQGYQLLFELTTS